jgi:hypothetical protein
VAVVLSFATVLPSGVPQRLSRTNIADTRKRDGKQAQKISVLVVDDDEHIRSLKAFRRGRLQSSLSRSTLRLLLRESGIALSIRPSRRPEGAMLPSHGRRSAFNVATLPGA